MQTYDALVVGGGPAGLAAAATLAMTGASVALIALDAVPTAASTTPPDTRTAALFTGSLALLRYVGAFDHLADAITPLRGIRIVDDGDGLLRAPEVTFEAHEMGLADFGANVPQQALGRALRYACGRLSDLKMISGQMVRLNSSATGIDVGLADGATLSARLVVAADGRNSLSRIARGIETETWDYPQVAIAAQFAHSRAHHGISTEFHRSSGPCTVVPMPGKRSSLVWVESPVIAKRLTALDDAAFARALEGRLHGILGTVSDMGARRMFPLTCLKAKLLAKDRVVLVGEAGHTLPPIGAQGLNLGLRDVAVLADLVADARASGEDIGSDALCSAYDNARRTDIMVRATAVDWLNRSLLADFLPADLARGLGLHVVGSIGALKRRVMQAGFEPSGSLPRLMRG